MVDAYFPRTLKEALEIRKDRPAIPYGGGTDLMVREGHDKPFLFIGSLEELKTVTKAGDHIAIGAACTYADLLKDDRIPAPLRKSVEEVAAPAIRNLGTIGGNVCNASPAGDTLPVLYAMNALLVLESADGTRIMGIDEFIQGVKNTVLGKDQLLTRILIPEGMTGYAYMKIGARKSLAISKLVFTGVHRVDRDVIEDVGIAFGAVGPTVLRSRGIEEKILGKRRGELDIEGILNDYAAIIHPIDDQRSTAEYRRKTCLNLLREYLTSAL